MCHTYKIFYVVHVKGKDPLQMAVLMGATTKKQAIKLWMAWNPASPKLSKDFKVSKVKLYINR